MDKGRARQLHAHKFDHHLVGVRRSVESTGPRRVIRGGFGLRSAIRSTFPSAYSWRMRTFSLFGRPLAIGPEGIKTDGRWPNESAAMVRPGTILSQTPRYRAPSNMLCDRPMAADIAITSRLRSESSIPSCPCVTPSHIAGTPPATGRPHWRCAALCG